MKIRKTLVVCPESRRSEIVAVLFPSSTSFPETKTLKRIKKRRTCQVFHVYKFFSPEMGRLSHSDLFWKDAKRREHCQDVCLQVTLCSSLYSSCFKGKWDLSQDSIWQKNEDKVTLAHFLKFILFHSSMNFSIYLVSQTVV